MADHTEDVMLTLVQMSVMLLTGNTEVEMSSSQKILIIVTGTKNEEKSIDQEMKYE